MDGIRKIHICGLSDVGRTRNRNEDAFLINNIVERTGLIDVSFDMESTGMKNQGLLAAVADGMGGMGSGHIASMIGLQEFSKHYYSKIASDLSHEQMVDLIRQSSLSAHNAIAEASTKNPDASRMGTTLVGLTVMNGILYRYHIGDSRLYRYRENELLQVTKDHSLVQYLVDSGKLSEQQAETFSRKNEITNSMGGGSICKPEIMQLAAKDFRPGDIFLLCSDGLSNMLDHIESGPEFDALVQLLAQSQSKEREFDKIKKNISSGDLFDRLDPVLDGIDRAFSSKEDHQSIKKQFDEVCKNISQVHSNWQGWNELLAIFLAEKGSNPISDILKTDITLSEKAKRLIESANERTSKDNITVVLLEVF